MPAKLRTATAEARFLFPKEIEVLLETLHRNALRVSGLRTPTLYRIRRARHSSGRTRNKVVEEESILVQNRRGGRSLFDEIEQEIENPRFKDSITVKFYRETFEFCKRLRQEKR
jgi:hypothetical protein